MFGGICVFYWGKFYVFLKVVGDRMCKVKRYYCCGEEVGDLVGCFKKDYYVFKISDLKCFVSIFNFEKILENLLVVFGRVVCFDCEMGYIVYGMEFI